MGNGHLRSRFRQRDRDLLFESAFRFHRLRERHAARVLGHRERLVIERVSLFQILRRGPQAMAPASHPLRFAGTAQLRGELDEYILAAGKRIMHHARTDRRRHDNFHRTVAYLHRIAPAGVVYLFNCHGSSHKNYSGSEMIEP